MGDLYCVNLAKLELPFPEFLPLYRFKLMWATQDILSEILKRAVEVQMYSFPLGRSVEAAHALSLICRLL